MVLANPLTLDVGLQFSGGSITSGTLNVAGSSTQSAVMGVSGTTINNSGDYGITIASGNLFNGTGSVFHNFGNVTRSGGAGAVTFNIALDNEGIFSVESGTLTLFSANTVANSGLLQAGNGGLLILSGSGGGVFTNADGTIEALDGSQVQLTNGAAVTGATFSTDGSGLVR